MAEAELTTVARPYARAAFSFALEPGQGLDAWSRMLALLAEAVATDLVRDALENPLLRTDQESGLLIDLLGEELTDNGRNFVVVLAENARLPLLPHIAALFEDLKAQHEKTLDVEVATAFDIDETDQEQLVSALKARWQKEINLSTRVDRALIGGVVIRAEDTVIDNSVRGKLQKMAAALS
ncbi:MAG: F0F1 ATP synthase subunit delta [Pseudomonadota bacterium]